MLSINGLHNLNILSRSFSLGQYVAFTISIGWQLSSARSRRRVWPIRRRCSSAGRLGRKRIGAPRTGSPSSWTSRLDGNCSVGGRQKMTRYAHFTAGRLSFISSAVHFMYAPCGSWRKAERP